MDLHSGQAVEIQLAAEEMVVEDQTTGGEHYLDLYCMIFFSYWHFPKVQHMGLL